jgi:hypothetical protein
MRSRRHQTGTWRNPVTAGVLCSLLAGCSVMGPAAIRSGRLAYNDAISETDNQQLLMEILHNRYEERGSLLAVASVTANVSVTTSAGIELGFGDNDNYAGNLVPFGAQAVYEENPTISYTPVQGDKYSRQLMSPLPVTALAQLAGTLADPADVYTTLVSSVNGIQNPDFLFSAGEPDPRFSRFVTIMATLTHANILHWVESPQHKGSFSVLIHHHAPTYSAEVKELFHLLGLPVPADLTAQVILPVSLALDGRESGGIGIITRSVYRLMEVLSAAVAVPEEDQRDGVTASYPELGLAGKDLQIRHSTSRPQRAAVAVKYRDGWFYIDDTDKATKRYFRLLGTLWSVTIAESAGKGAAAPVLTVPVSR